MCGSSLCGSSNLAEQQKKLANYQAINLHPWCADCTADAFDVGVYFQHEFASVVLLMAHIHYKS